MLTANTRAKARSITKILNTIAGCKRFKQPKININGSWGLVRVTGKLTAPVTANNRIIKNKPEVLNKTIVNYKRSYKAKLSS